MTWGYDMTTTAHHVEQYDEKAEARLRERADRLLRVSESLDRKEEVRYAMTRNRSTFGQLICFLVFKPLTWLVRKI